ncbi:hypothetical protein D3C87_2006060 [compost metagenome]
MLPDRAAKVGLPVVWRAAILAFAPNIVVTLGVVFRGSGLNEPRMLIGSMIKH